MRLSLLMIVVAAGCGRVGFDMPVDGGVDGAGADVADGTAAATHDEDQDGIPDAIDKCPHIADPGQADQDGDGVGDACDPRISTAGDSIALFVPFTGPTTAFTMTGVVPTFDGESMFVDARGGSFLATLPDAPVHDTYIIGGHIGAAATGNHQITLAAVGVSPKQFYCELYDAGPWFGLTYTLDGASYPNLATSPLQLTPLGNRDFVLSLATAASPGATCKTTWPVAMPTLSGSPPTTIMPTSVAILFMGIDVRVDYFVHIHSP